MSEERLQKILARAGVASRRKAEELIREGRVTVNGRPAAIGDKADLARDSVKLDERRIQAPATHRYLLLNKPRGVMSTVADPAGRTTVIDLVPPAMRRALAPVGRLDFQTEGLLLLTDDGDLAQQVAHPSFGCWKTYEVKVRGRPAPDQIERLRAGIVLEGRRTAPCRITPLRRSSKTTPAALRRARAGGGQGVPGRRGRPRSAPESDNASWWSVELGEGRTRQIREMFQRIGHPVQKLRRIAIGPVSDPDLPVGSLRELSEREVAALRRAGPPPARQASGAGRGGTTRGRPPEARERRANDEERPLESPRRGPPFRGARAGGGSASPGPQRPHGGRAAARGPRSGRGGRAISPGPKAGRGGRAASPGPRPADRRRDAASPGPRQAGRGRGAVSPAPRRAGRRDGAPGPRTGRGRGAASGPRRRPGGRGKPAGPGGRRRG